MKPANEQLQPLVEKPEQFDLFAALRLLESTYATKPRLGESISTTEEAVSLRQKPSLSFSPADLVEFNYEEVSEKDVLYNLAFGLFGPHGALPIHLTEHAYIREHNHSDPTFARFLDVFHHRFISLFYRAWANSQPAIEMDRPDENRFDLYSGAFCGMAEVNDETQSILSRDALLFYSGLLGMQHRPAEALLGILRDYFDLPFVMEQCTGEWISIDDNNLFSLGEDESSTGCQLGMNSYLGDTTYSIQNSFTLVCGPVAQEEYQNFLPGSTNYLALCEWVRLFTRGEFDWQLQFVLDDEETPDFSLGHQGALGWSTWLGDETENNTNNTVTF